MEVSITREIKIFFLLGILLISFCQFTNEAFALGKNVTFVDSGYEGQSMKGQPSGKGVGFSYKTSYYHVAIRYPSDHRVEKWPLKQQMSIQVGRIVLKDVTFKVLHLRLVDQNANEIQLVHGISDHESLLNKEFKANGIPLDFFSDIPKNVDQLTLEFKIEIKSPSGTEVLERTIPLKRASYKTSFSEVFWRHERWKKQ